MTKAAYDARQVAAAMVALVALSALAGLAQSPAVAIRAGGLQADLIAVSGNPLEDVKLLQDVRFVMKGGRVVKQPAPATRAVTER